MGRGRRGVQMSRHSRAMPGLFQSRVCRQGANGTEAVQTSQRLAHTQAPDANHAPTGAGWGVSWGCPALLCTPLGLPDPNRGGGRRHTLAVMARRTALAVAPTLVGMYETGR